ncbi:Glycosyl hydrolase family 7 [Aureococcus anophagefferens]|uniref:cellulose 1,4-beta-cellobiosidase (non-reducing end) n=1 Tax=Aureococcus anophagefferens TaxID=44056 RepID=A0ABR1G0C9_AURAN
MEGFSDGGFACGLAADGLPVVEPKRASVRAMLGDADPEASLGACPPSNSACHLWRVAACAVLAGCEPRQFPLVVAAVRALLDDAFNAHGTGATTMAARAHTPPSASARARRGVNCGRACLGSGTRANACVGRALKLVLHHVGGASVGGTESTTAIARPPNIRVVGERDDVVAGGWGPYGGRGAPTCTLFPVTGMAQVVDFDTTDPKEPNHKHNNTIHENAMPHHTVAALLLLPAALAQVPGTQTPEHHPSLRISECTADKTCTTLDKSIVLDANWRWTDVGGTNCYTGNAWCPDPTTCASHCALEGADYEGTYGIHAAGDELQLDFVTHGSYGDNVGSRVYLLDGEDKYHLFKLKNREFSVTIDDSTLGCGLNGALYFGQYRCDGEECGDGHGDARSKGVCDKDGCDFAPYRLGATQFFGEGSGRPTTPKQFTVVTQFLTTDGTDEGDLSEIRRFFLQDGAVVPDPTVSVGGDTFDRLSDGFCARAQKKAFGDENTFEARGGLAAVGDQMDAGMVLVMSLWDDHDRSILFHRGKAAARRARRNTSLNEMDALTAGVWPWSAADAAMPAVLSEQLAYQYLSGFLIGCGVGGVVGASTLGVAMFSLIAPVGSLKAFTAVVPVVNCCANLGHHLLRVASNFAESGAKRARRRRRRRTTTSATAAAVKAENEAFYGQIWVAAGVSILCGVLAVITNNSGRSTTSTC